MPVEPEPSPASLPHEEEQARVWRKKPVEIEAVRWTGDNLDEMDTFLPEGEYGLSGNVLHIPTLEGVMDARPGDWIIRGVKGEFYPCKPDIFAATYERVVPRSPSPERAQERVTELREVMGEAVDEIQNNRVEDAIQILLNALDATETRTPPSEREQERSLTASDWDELHESINARTPPSQGEEAVHDPLTCDWCHSEGAAAEVAHANRERDEAREERDKLAEKAKRMESALWEISHTYFPKLEDLHDFARAALSDTEKETGDA